MWRRKKIFYPDYLSHNVYFIKVFCDDDGNEYEYDQSQETDSCDPVFNDCGDPVDPLPGIDPPVDDYYEDEECDDIFDDCGEECLSINEIDDTIFNR